MFVVGRQEDASEFFTKLFESMAESSNFNISPAMARVRSANSTSTGGPSANNNTSSRFNFAVESHARVVATCPTPLNI